MIRKAPTMTSALDQFIQAKAPAPEAPLPMLERDRSRRGMTLQLLLPSQCAQEMRHGLKLIALEQNSNQTDLLLEALQDLFVKYGKRPPLCKKT